MTPQVQVGAEVDTPTGCAAAQVVRIIIHVFPLDLPEDTGDLHMPPILLIAVMGREVRQGKTSLHTIQPGVFIIFALITTGARPLERHHEVGNLQGVIEEDLTDAGPSIGVPRAEVRQPAVVRADPGEA